MLNKPNLYVFKQNTYVLFWATFFLFLLSSYSYGKYKIKKWSNEQKIEIKVQYCLPILKNFIQPTLLIKGLTIRNVNKTANFSKISAHSIRITPKFFKFVKTFFQSYTLAVEVNGLKINDFPSNYATIESLSGLIHYRKGVYTFENLLIRPLQFRLTPEYSTLDKGKLREQTHTLTISEINIAADYLTKTRKLNLHLYAPNARVSPAEPNNYTLKAKGNLAITLQRDVNNSNLPAQGDVTFTIENFSNLLDHLHEILIISTLADNLGSILGYPAPKKGLTDNEIKEIMTNSATVLLKLKEQEAYVGPFKIYP